MVPEAVTVERDLTAADVDVGADASLDSDDRMIFAKMRRPGPEFKVFDMVFFLDILAS